MTYTSNKTNMATAKAFASGGHEKLVVYWLAVFIYDLNQIFIDRYIDRKLRTYDQMLQAARSGKQNIVEGWQQHSIEGNLKLLDIARASFTELKEDYGDYARSHKLKIWIKDDPRVLVIRRTRDLAYTTYLSYKSYTTYMNNPESYANLMITLLYKEMYLLDGLLRSTRERFVREGGFRENLFRKRQQYRQHS